MELVLTLIIAAGLAFIPATIAKKKGYSFGLWWLYGWLLFIVAIIHVSLIPDKNASSYPAAPAAQNSSYPAAPVAQTPSYPAAPAPSSPSSAPVHSTAEELKLYKELLDAGILTQEEFDAKKKQLLNLN